MKMRASHRAMKTAGCAQYAPRQKQRQEQRQREGAHGARKCGSLRTHNLSSQIRAAVSTVDASVVKQEDPLTRSVLGWSELSNAIELNATTAKDTVREMISSYRLRQGQVPSSSPDEMRGSGSGDISHNIDTTTALPNNFSLAGSDGVLLYRDTNSWCPFCERVWIALLEKGIPYESVGVDLRNKPEWYKEMIPTALVPSVRLFPSDELIYESKDILLKLEDTFSDVNKYQMLLPQDETMRSRALEIIESAEEDTSVVRLGYKVLLARRTSDREGERKENDQDEGPSEEEIRSSFEGALKAFDNLLLEHGGPFIMGNSITICDIMLIPGLTRLAANLRTFADMEIRFNDQYVQVGKWFEAVDSLPSQQFVRTDDETLNNVVGKIFMNGAAFDETDKKFLTPPLSEAGKLEAAYKLTRNYKRVIQDIFTNSGICESEEESVDIYVRAIVMTLLGQTIAGLRSASPQRKMVGAAVMAFLRNRVTSPRDMSASATVAFRHATDKLCRMIY